MKKINSIIVILLMVAFLGACSDDSDDTGTNPTGETLNFPLAQGNMWEYDVYEVDGNEMKTDNKLGTNKTTVGEAITLDGRSGFKMIEESTIVEEEDDDPGISAVSADNDGVYVYFDSFSEDGGNPLSGITPGWTKLIDFNNSSWEAFNFPIDVVDGESTTKGTFIMTGEKVGDVSTTYKGTNYDGVQYKVTINLDAKFTSPDFNLELESENYTYYTIVDGIGFVDIKTIETDDETQEKSGTNEMLVNHSVK